MSKDWIRVTRKRADGLKRSGHSAITKIEAVRVDDGGYETVVPIGSCTNIELLTPLSGVVTVRLDVVGIEEVIEEYDANHFVEGADGTAVDV